MLLDAFIGLKGFFLFVIPHKEVTHSRLHVFMILVFYLNTMNIANC